MDFKRYISFILFFMISISYGQSYLSGEIIGSNRDSLRIVVKNGIIKSEANLFISDNHKDPKDFKDPKDPKSIITNYDELCFTNIKLVKTFMVIDEKIARKCFNYDAAGNKISAEDCALGQGDENNEEEEGTNYSKYFTLYPNPASTVAKLSWDEEVAPLVKKIILVPISGFWTENININSQEKTASFKVYAYPKGNYGLKIFLSNGKVVTKTLQIQ